MQIAFYFLVSTLYFCASVLGTGLAFSSWLDRALQRVIVKDRPTLLFISAVGLYYNTLVFIAMYLTRATLTPSLIIGKIIIELFFIITCMVINSRYIYSLFNEIAQDGATLIFAAGGVLIGLWAMLEFPHVLDSGQILWTQQVVDSGFDQTASAMVGYSALVGLYGELLKTSPIVSTAAAFKPFLIGLYGAIAVLLGTVLTPRNRVLIAASYFLLSLMSTFGLYGLVELGKDSIWGILFAMAFFGTLCRRDASSRSIELSLYFVVATALGVIALPYMIAAYVLWLLFSEAEDRAINSVPAIILGALPILPAVLAGFLGIGLARAYISFGLFTGVILTLHRYNVLLATLLRISRLARVYRAGVPILCLALCIFLFPVSLTFPVWVNADGSVLTESRFPLDGVTTFFGYIYSYPAQNVMMSLGMLATLVGGFSPLVRSRPGLMALITMPFFVLLLTLVRAHSNLNIISNFNIWDMVKDIPQWLGGTLIPFFTLGVLVSLAANFRSSLPLKLVVIGTTFICAVLSLKRTELSFYTHSVTYKEFASSRDPDMAEAANLVWTRLKGSELWVDPDLPISKQCFYSFQMYGGRPSTYEASKLDKMLSAMHSDVGFLVKNDQLARIKKAAEHLRASIDYLAPLQNGEASIIAVRMDGMQNSQIPTTIDAATVSAGHYDLENANQASFYWMKSQAEIAVMAPNVSTACVSVALFDSGVINERQTVSLVNAEGQKTSVIVSGSSVVSPVVLSQTVQVVDGKADLKLIAGSGDGTFPNDTRRIAYGLRLPVRLDGQACVVKNVP